MRGFLLAASTGRWRAACQRGAKRLGSLVTAKVRILARTAQLSSPKPPVFGINRPAIAKRHSFLRHHENPHFCEDHSIQVQYLHPFHLHLQCRLPTLNPLISRPNNQRFTLSRKSVTRLILSTGVSKGVRKGIPSRLRFSHRFRTPLRVNR